MGVLCDIGFNMFSSSTFKHTIMRKLEFVASKFDVYEFDAGGHGQGGRAKSEDSGGEGHV
jgi:hypothetical protein